MPKTQESVQRELLSRMVTDGAKKCKEVDYKAFDSAPHKRRRIRRRCNEMEAVILSGQMKLPLIEEMDDQNRCCLLHKSHHPDSEMIKAHGKNKAKYLLLLIVEQLINEIQWNKYSLTETTKGPVKGFNCPDQYYWLGQYLLLFFEALESSSNQFHRCSTRSGLEYTMLPAIHNGGHQQDVSTTKGAIKIIVGCIALAPSEYTDRYKIAVYLH